MITTAVVLFAIMGVLTLPPVFLAVTSEMDARQRRTVAIQTGFAVAATMIVSYLLGSWILALFKIDIEAFRVAGALIVASMAWGMITGRASALLDSNGRSPAVIPLAIPKIAGPGAIALAISLGAETDGIQVRGDLVAIIVVTLLALIAMFAANPIERILGDSGLNTLNRLFGLVMLAIAVTSIMTSLLNFFPGWAN